MIPTRPRLVTLLLAGLGLSVAVAFSALRLARPSDGAVLDASTHFWHADGVAVTPLGAETPLHAGDVVVAVAGRPLDDWAGDLLDMGVERPRWRAGDAVTYTVRRDGRLVDLTVPLRPYPLGAALRGAWGALLCAVVFWGASLFVFSRRPDERPAQLLFLGGSSMVAATTWSFGLQVGDFVRPAAFWLYLAGTHGFYLLLWATMLHLTLTFPRPLLPRARRALVPAIYLAPYLVKLGYPLWIRPQATSTLDWLGRQGRDVNVIQLVYVLAAMVAAVAAARAARDPVSRRQVRWVLVALHIAFGFAITFGLLPELIVGTPLLSWNVIALVGLTVPVALGAAILRYRLFDIDLILSRTLVYGLLTFVVVTTYILVVGGLGALLRVDSSLPLSLAATGVVAVLFQPLRERLQRAINRVLYGERDDPYAVLSRLGRRLETTVAPEALLPTLAETIATALKLPYAGILLEGESEPIGYGLPTADPLSLPLVHQHAVLGRLLVAPRAPDEPFTAGERRLLEDIARQAGAAAQAVRLTGDLQRSRERLVTAREEERRRLRRDLHDGLGPALASLVLQAEAAGDLVAANPDEARRLLAEIADQAETAVADVRRLVYNLRPPALDDLGLLGALDQLRRRFQTNGLAITLEAPAALPDLPAAVEVAVYRLVQEGVTNVVRHARARHCTISLAAPGDLHLLIQDDGQGLSADAVAGVGLRSMQERVAELGGAWSIEAAPGGGTRIEARLPLAIADHGLRIAEQPTSPPTHQPAPQP